METGCCFAFSPRFYFVLDRCPCPLTERIPLMLPPLAFQLFHCSTSLLSLLVFQLLYTHISECLLIFLLLDKSPGRHYQPPVLGQEHAGNHGGSCRVLFALHICTAFGLADPELSVIAHTVLDTESQ